MIKPEVLDAMVASGCTAEQISAVVKASCLAQEEAAQTRREKDRERKRAVRELEKLSASVRDVPEESELSAGILRTATESTDKADNGFLSPVPLLPPIPPNNPLTPKPSTKTNSRGSRLPADWTMNGPDLAYALSKNLSEREAIGLFERFCSWAWSASGSNAVKVNWHQAWQGWVQRDGPKILAARASPSGKPLTEFQRGRKETQGILDDLEHFASGSSTRSQGNTRLISGYSGERPERLRGGSGEDVIDLPAGSYRSGG